MRKGSYQNSENDNDMNLVALVDIKSTYMMLTNWSAAVRNGDTKEKKWVRNWCNSIMVKCTKVSTIAGMQSMTISTMERVSCHSKNHFFLMIGI